MFWQEVKEAMAAERKEEQRRRIQRLISITKQKTLGEAAIAGTMSSRRKADETRRKLQEDLQVRAITLSMLLYR